MKQVTSILVCTHPDNPDYALADQAAAIAKKTGAAVKVFHVISEYPEDMSEWWNVRNPQKLHEKIVGDREQFLSGIAERIRLNGARTVTYELKWGRNFIEIVREVAKNKHDLVMITAGRKTKLGRMILECPSVDLLRHCPCVLWITKGEMGQTKKRIVAALGGKTRRFECDLFNAKILRTAAGLAEALGSELHVVHALPLYGGKGLKGTKLRPELEKYVDEYRQDMIEKCAAALSEHDVKLDPKRVHLLTGSPGSVITEFVQEEGMDLVVMGSVARGGVQGLVLGSTAERVFNQVSCSVAAVKPDDFVSLVELEEQTISGRKQESGRTTGTASKTIGAASAQPRRRRIASS